MSELYNGGYTVEQLSAAGVDSSSLDKLTRDMSPAIIIGGAAGGGLVVLLIFMACCGCCPCAAKGKGSAATKDEDASEPDAAPIVFAETAIDFTSHATPYGAAKKKNQTGGTSWIAAAVGAMSREEATAKVRAMNPHNPVGCFLIRESNKASDNNAAPTPILSVCISQDGKMDHHRITVNAAGMFTLNNRQLEGAPECKSMNELIQYLVRRMRTYARAHTHNTALCILALACAVSSLQPNTPIHLYADVSSNMLTPSYFRPLATSTRKQT